MITVLVAPELFAAGVGQRGEPGNREEPGDRGEPGNREEPGDRGEPGNREEAGDRGELGSRGEQGNRGELGDRREPGDRRERGERPTLVVEGDAYRHLFRARRLAAGERLRIVDGEGHARWGDVLRVGRTGADIALGGDAPTNEPHRRLELLVATLRPEPAAWLVEKATELGVLAVRFLNTERAPRSFGGGTAARLRRVAAAAVEQSHRARCPEVTGPHPLSDLPLLTAGADRRLLLDPAAPHPLPAGAGLRPTLDLLLIGPEGGWSPAELTALRQTGWAPHTLGPRILRIETAALAAAALLLLS